VIAKNAEATNKRNKYKFVPEKRWIQLGPEEKGSVILDGSTQCNILTGTRI
jgi:hypothetical protein